MIGAKNMYFIHDRYDEGSHRMLESLDNSVVVVDYYADPERYKRIKGLQKIPCCLDKLEFEQDGLSALWQKVAELDVKLARANAELAELGAKQADQESILIECFTDLDASINGGDQNAQVV